MKKQLAFVALGAAVGLVAGCSTTSSVNEYRGSALGSPEPTGNERVTFSALQIQPRSLDNIQLSVSEEVSQVYATEYRRMRDTHYRTRSPDGGPIFTGALVGGGLAGLGYLLNDDCAPDDSFCSDDDYDVLIDMGAVFAGLGILFGVLDPKTTRRTETRQVGTMVENETRTSRRNYAYSNEPVTLFDNESTRIKETTTDNEGRFAILEPELLEAGYHPAALVASSGVSLRVETERHAETFTVPIADAEIPKSVGIVNEAAIEQLLDADFQDLIGDRSVRVTVRYDDRSEGYWFDLTRLPENFFATHYRRNENDLSETFGSVLSNCRTISRHSETDEVMYREVYRCLGRMSQEDIDTL